MTIEQTVVQTSRSSHFRAGFLAGIPLWLGAAPFGLIYAVSALSAGLTPAQTAAMSLFVFAGASQFTAVGMIAAGSGPFAVVLTTLIVNARHLLLTASLLPYLRGLPKPALLGLAAQLTDESYALAIGKFLAGTGKPAFLAGANMSIYVVWQVSAWVGIWLGRSIPDPAAYGLDLVFPLTFIGLLVPLLRRPGAWPIALIAALISIITALLLPGGWHILFAAIGAGLFAGNRRQPV
ncbi:MAG: AzlC family ABC transporter permease [Oscillochloris sp.]|nr:AzlC family ABC transporter permease [Oscillochloris sp.]